MSNHEPAQEPRGPSYPHVPVLVIFGLLAWAASAGRASWWGILPHIAALAFVLWSAYETASRGAYDRIAATHPGYGRDNWVLNMVICYIVLPLIVWVVFGFGPLADWIGAHS